MEDIDIPTNCSLPRQDAAIQVLQWADLRSLATSSQLVSNGVRLTFSVEVEDALRSLVAREQMCCPNFAFSIERGHDSVTLEVATDDADAQTMIANMSGVSP